MRRRHRRGCRAILFLSPHLGAAAQRIFLVSVPAVRGFRHEAEIGQPGGYLEDGNAAYVRGGTRVRSTR